MWYVSAIALDWSLKFDNSVQLVKAFYIFSIELEFQSGSSLCHRLSISDLQFLSSKFVSPSYQILHAFLARFIDESSILYLGVLKWRFSSSEFGSNVDQVWNQLLELIKFDFFFVMLDRTSKCWNLHVILSIYIFFSMDPSRRVPCYIDLILVMLLSV